MAVINNGLFRVLDGNGKTVIWHVGVPGNARQRRAKVRQWKGLGYVVSRIKVSAELPQSS